MKLYGIKNCDTVRKAKKWLEANNIEHTFVDFRVDGLTQADIEAWLEHTSWETLFNKRSTSFRGLTDEQKADIDQAKAIALMLEHPTLIKRPVLAMADGVMVGFKEADYQGALL
ncbi:ArsC family reductase [Paraferrimonas sp. SM1919]|uniref:ArsC family reductase n=1 Tax=Paraferrimonas sp. SM1919 TaxID=2662263 RepID=UPI0013D43AE4|nr:ArsC family reductase [Paraferrimonas sp. SM1919]